MQSAVYNDWASLVEPGAEILSFKAEMLETFSYLPRISVLMVVSDPDEVWIKRSVSSVLGQIYPRFELCACDNASGRPHVMESLKELATSDERIEAYHLQEPVSQAEAYNRALSLATGEFVTLIDAGDELAPDALSSGVESLQSIEADVVYADEDSVDIANRRSDPIFKPYWSPDLLLSTMYVGRPCMIRRELVEKTGGFREGFEGGEEHDLMLRLSEKTKRIQHIPRMLYHRRTYVEEPDNGSEYRAARRRAVEEALERRVVGEETMEVEVESGSVPGSIRVVRSILGQPTVSVVALGLDEETAGSAGHLVEQSSYPVHEVLVTGPTVGEEPPEGSLAALVNQAAGGATGEYLLFLRNYQGATSPDWIADLLRQARRSEVGVVGARTLDTDGGILSVGGYAELNKLVGGPPNTSLGETHSPFLPVVDYPFNPHAVSLDCMMVSRDLFKEIGGFDEALPTAFYDLDFSFRLAEKDLLNVYTPDVSVLATGGSLPPAGAEEIAYMWRRWWAFIARELHYRKSPLDRDYGAFEGEPPFFLQVQSEGRIARH